MERKDVIMFDNIVNNLFNSSFFIALLGFNAVNDTALEGKHILNCREATIQYDIQLKDMSIGDKGWVPEWSNSKNTRASKRCGASYNTLVTKIHHFDYMYEYKGKRCKSLTLQNKPCYNIKKLR